MAFKVKSKVWYEGEKWTIVEIFKPNKFQTFLTLHRFDKKAKYEDGTRHEWFTMIETKCSRFYPDTVLVRSKLELVKIYGDKIPLLHEQLNEIWENYIEGESNE